MKAPIEMSSIVDHEAQYQSKKQLDQITLRRQREQSIKDHKDHINNLPYTPNLRNNPNDELSRFRQVQEQNIRADAMKRKQEKMGNYSKYVKEMYWPKVSVDK